MMHKVAYLLSLIVFLCYAEWIQTSPLLNNHIGHVAINLENGNVLVIGGDGVTKCQIYDDATEIWSYTDDLNIGRKAHAAVLLQDGRVLVIGGGYPYNAGFGYCELYNTTTGTWTITDSLHAARTG